MKVSFSTIAKISSARVSAVFGTRVHPVTKKEQFHNGIDIPMPIGTPIRSPWDGEVVVLNQHNHGGRQMRIKHDNGTTSGYAHLEAWCALIGQRVKAGDIIAYSGNTGVGTGPHLHFTLRSTATGKEFDPLTVITFP